MFGMYFEDYEQAQQEALESIDEYAHAVESGTLDNPNMFSDPLLIVPDNVATSQAQAVGRACKT